MPAKKSSTKKRVATKKVANKKVVSKPKKSVTKRSSRYESLKSTDSQLPFMTFQITKQTFYWTALLVFILLVQVWALNVQLKTADSIKNLEEVLITSSK